MKTQTITKDSIIEAYSDYILIHGERPKNIYQFTKDLNTTEQEFYKYYGNFEAIERDYLKILFEKSLELSITAEGYASQSSKEKLLNLYYIFIENLTLNRSFVLELLKGNARQMMIKMQSLKNLHRQFVETLHFGELELLKKTSKDFQRWNEKSREEILWIHFVSIIEFWKNDLSPQFEKTDLYIEKTIDTGFELIDNEPIRKFIDLGKFLYKEKFGK